MSDGPLYRTFLVPGGMYVHVMERSYRGPGGQGAKALCGVLAITVTRAALPATKADISCWNCRRIIAAQPGLGLHWPERDVDGDEE